MSSLIGRAYRFFQYTRNAPFRRALSDYESVFGEILDDLHSEQAKKTPLSISSAWDTRNQDFNASVGPGFLTDTHQIRINVSCFINLISTANLAFGSRDLFNWIGKADKESGDFSQRLASENRDDYTPPPIDSLRQEAANVVTEIGISLIVLHEIGHVALGHTRLGKDVIRNPRFRESDAKDDHISPEEAQVYHACEIEADRFSFSYALNLASQGRSPFYNQLVSDELRPHIFDLAVFAYILVITFLHKEDKDLAHYTTKQHPHPSVRLYSSQFSFLSFLEGQNELIAQYSAALKDSFQILHNGAYQQTTIHLITNERDKLTGCARELEECIKNRLHPNSRRFDFRTGTWIASHQ